MAQPSSRFETTISQAIQDDLLFWCFIQNRDTVILLDLTVFSPPNASILPLTLHYLFCWLVPPIFYSSIFSSWFYFFPTPNRRTKCISFVFWEPLTCLYNNRDITIVLTVSVLSVPELPYNVMVKQYDKVKNDWQKHPVSLDGIIGV